MSENSAFSKPKSRLNGLVTRVPRQFYLDTAIVLSSWVAILVVTNITVEEFRSNQSSLVLALTGTAATLFIMKRRGLYNEVPSVPRTDEIARVFIAAVGGAASISVAAAFLDWLIGAWEIIMGGALTFCSRTLIRGFVRSLATELPGRGQQHRVVIVGSGYESKELAELITDHPETRFELAGVVGNYQVAEHNDLAGRWIGPTDRLIEIMHQRNISGAIVTATGFRAERFRNITRELFAAGYEVHLTTGVSRMWEGRFDTRSLAHEPLVVLGRNEPANWNYGAKRLLDVLLASIAIVLLSPIMFATAAIIWLQDRGPVTYSSRRAGRSGEFFDMYKFRSMVTNADKLKEEMAADNQRTGPLFKMSADPRVTKFGKLIRETSIDELPQFFNVLKGDMSLVGPRPALPEEESAFDDELRERFQVRPGITGLWQVEARSNASFNAYRRLDLHYVENWNIALDFRILLATAEQVLVTLVLMPMRFLRRSSAAVDGVTTVPAQDSNGSGKGVVIDLTALNNRRIQQAAKAAAFELDPLAVEVNDVGQQRRGPERREM